MTGGLVFESEAVRLVREAEEAEGRLYGPWGRGDGLRSGQLALLVDFENLVLGAIASLPGRADAVPAAALTWLCRAYGATRIRRAYADWANPRFGRYQSALERNGIDLVQLGHGPARKNGADIRMAVDAMETLIVHPGVEGFVLVSGDSDFSPLVSKLREHGKHVIGVGAETTASARLVSVCSEYKLWGSIVARLEPPERASQPAKSEAAPVLAHRIEDAEELLVTAMEQLPTPTPTASAVKSRMVTLDPAFDQLNYGCRSFREFLGVLSHRIRVVGNSGGDITLTLIALPTEVSHREPR